MTVALTATDPRKGRYFLAEGPNGPADLRRTEHAVSAAMWESPAELARWLDRLPPEALATIEARKARMIWIELDLTGCGRPVE